MDSQYPQGHPSAKQTVTLALSEVQKEYLIWSLKTRVQSLVCLFGQVCSINASGSFLPQALCLYCSFYLECYLVVLFLVNSYLSHVSTQMSAPQR